MKKFALWKCAAVFCVVSSVSLAAQTTPQYLSSSDVQIGPAFIASNFTGADAAAKINACLVASTAAGKSRICDARNLGPSLTFGSNAFAGITTPFTLLMPYGALINTSATQVITAGYSVIDGGQFGNPLLFKWTGASGGTVFDIKDAGELRLFGVGVECNGVGGRGFLMSGGYQNTFNDRFDGVEVANCNVGGLGANSVGIDNATISSFNVTMSRSGGGSISAVVTSGAFPSNWVGQTMAEVAVSGASDSTYNYAITEAAPFTTPTCAITSTTAATCSPASTTWNPANGSGVTATLSSYAGMQNWDCFACYIYTNEIGYQSRWPYANFHGGTFAFSGTAGYRAYMTAAANFFGVTFSVNQTDLDIAGNNTLTSSQGGWFENSNATGHGIAYVEAGINNFTLNIYGSLSMHTHSTSDVIDFSAAATGVGTTGSINLSGNYLNGGTSWTIKGNGNPAMTVNANNWSHQGVFPIYNNVVLGDVLYGTGTFGSSSSSSDQLQLRALGVFPDHRGFMIGSASTDGGLYSIIDNALPSPGWFWNTSGGANKASLDSSGNFNIVGGYKLQGNVIIPTTVIGSQGAGAKLALPFYGSSTLAAGTVTVSSANACTPSATCVYRLTRCAANSSTAIGSLSVGTVSAGTSFVINSLSATNTVATGDLSTVCWSIN